MRFKKIGAALLACAMCFGVFSTTAFAYVDESVATEEPAVEEKVPETEPEEPMLPLTPDGNLTLVDDAGSPTKSGKQFITAVTKNGNYFYIIIDRDDKGEETVHFLNQVDEADLMALMEDGKPKEEPPAVCSCTKKCEAGAVNTACPVCVTDKSKCTGKAPEPPAETSEPEKEKPAGLNPAALILLLALLGGGGVFAYLKLVKNKPKTKGNDSLDDYDYGEEDSEEWETEDEEVLEDGFEGSDPNEERDRAD